MVYESCWHGMHSASPAPLNRTQQLAPSWAGPLAEQFSSMGREERRALLEQRRAAVARQLRRLAIELTDLDRQLDEIERSER